MPRRYRKGSRKGSRKSHRKGSRKSHRKSHRRSRNQRGGGSCAAMPLNREVFAQRGGMAPYGTGDATLLDKATMIQAQSWQQVADIDSAQGLARSAQHGGARRKSRRGGRKSRRSTHRRSQRGGSYPWATGLQGFDKPYTLVPAGTATGVNPQFHTEGSVNSLYSESRGPQY